MNQLNRGFFNCSRRRCCVDAGADRVGGNALTNWPMMRRVRAAASYRAFNETSMFVRALSVKLR